MAAKKKTRKKRNGKPPFDPSVPMRNVRHEAFAINRALKKMSLADSYTAAGGDSVNPQNQGQKLILNLQIVARIDFLQTHIADTVSKEALWDREKILHELLRNLTLARMGGQIAPANKALELYGAEAHGMFQKVSVVLPAPGALLEGSSVKQLHDLIRTRCEELGIDFEQAVARIHGNLAGTRAALPAGDGAESGRVEAP